MTAKVFDLAAIRAQASSRCLRADFSVPKEHGNKASDARLNAALKAVALLQDAPFRQKVEVFKRVWQAGRKP